MPRFTLRMLGWLFAGYAMSSAPIAAYAQSDAAEPPLVAGRLTAAEGNAQIWRSDESGNGAWDAAQVNDVVTVASGLFTGPQSRIEVRWGPHAVRLGPDTRGGFSRIEYDDAAFNLEYGTLAVRLREGSSDRFAVTVAGMRVDLAAPGRYRIDAIEGSPLRITAFAGRAALAAPANSLSIAAGQALDVGPDGASFAFSAPAATALDTWALARDDAGRDAQSARYVSPYMTGYEDLDTNGEWIQDPDYGALWAPRVVVAGWAPYRYGRWRWVAPWGWTWVDDAPWGFAPFHYGRWVTVGGRWCWWPGQRVYRPVYAPALVGWVGDAGWSVSVSVGGPAYVGWYPLAPWNSYRPRYTTNVTYVNRINQVVIHREPPRGGRYGDNLRDGRTVVPGNGFREPIRRAVPPQAPVRDLRPVDPPGPRTGFVPGPRGAPGPVIQTRPPAATPKRPERPNEAPAMRPPAARPGAGMPDGDRGGAPNGRPPAVVRPDQPTPVRTLPAPAPARPAAPAQPGQPPKVIATPPRAQSPAPGFQPATPGQRQPQPGAQQRERVPTPRFERGPRADPNAGAAAPRPVPEQRAVQQPARPIEPRMSAGGGNQPRVQQRAPQGQERGAVQQRGRDAERPN